MKMTSQKSCADEHSSSDSTRIIQQFRVSGLEFDLALDSKMFKRWLASLDPGIVLKAVHFDSVSRIGEDHILFIKMETYAIEKSTGRRLPSVVHLSGGCVAVLVILNVEGKKYVVLVEQARLPVGSLEFLEIVAGRMDDSDDAAFVAQKELREEAHIEVGLKDLVNLTEYFAPEKKGLRPSAGFTDEFIEIFICEIDVSYKEIAAIDGRQCGLIEENEKIKLRVVPYEEVHRKTTDMKALSALCLYEKWLAEKERVK